MPVTPHQGGNNKARDIEQRIVAVKKIVFCRKVRYIRYDIFAKIRQGMTLLCRGQMYFVVLLISNWEIWTSTIFLVWYCVANCSATATLQLPSNIYLIIELIKDIASVLEETTTSTTKIRLTEWRNQPPERGRKQRPYLDFHITYAHNKLLPNPSKYHPGYSYDPTVACWPRHDTKHWCYGVNWAVRGCSNFYTHNSEVYWEYGRTSIICFRPL